MKNIVNLNLSTSRRVLAFIPHFSPYHTTTKHPSTIHHQSIHHPTNKPSPLLLPPSTLPNPLFNSSIDAIIPAAVDLRDLGLQAELYDDVLSVGVRDLPPYTFAKSLLDEKDRLIAAGIAAAGPEIEDVIEAVVAIEAEAVPNPTDTLSTMWISWKSPITLLLIGAIFLPMLCSWIEFQYHKWQLRDVRVIPIRSARGETFLVGRRELGEKRGGDRSLNEEIRDLCDRIRDLKGRSAGNGNDEEEEEEADEMDEHEDWEKDFIIFDF
ncbi:hypothetical protein IFR04_010254 [Cadophora malorum]|uniref:Uncharacterized protein n=1 Tax=Cadophora malorum TaxID=108018 RepID=A0A8H7TBT6_9HELO|nr:hypothetical protein IFR04_010254 [Cadophora malorum]